MLNAAKFWRIFLFCYFQLKFRISANVHVYCLKSCKLGIYLTAYGRVKACFYRAQRRIAAQTKRKAAQFAVLIESSFQHQNFCTGSKN